MYTKHNNIHNSLCPNFLINYYFLWMTQCGFFWMNLHKWVIDLVRLHHYSHYLNSLSFISKFWLYVLQFHVHILQFVYFPNFLSKKNIEIICSRWIVHLIHLNHDIQSIDSLKISNVNKQNKDLVKKILNSF